MVLLQKALTSQSCDLLAHSSKSERMQKNTKWLELKSKSRSKMTVIGESVSPYEQLKGTWCGV